ncbi:MAG: TetR/AcrR family transcriptional regulator [Acidobacteria bacterium]|nr:TetR/AcrR family transcriptional regulator [Acidobacteriota bacterium]MCW5947985.1 TetR/AcrR family transcriptional regulator [Pyrinomonadaceae bacterium]
MLKHLFNCEHTGRMSGDERREQILRAAVALFSQKGFKGTTTKEIASAVGISEAMVFRHFASKEELYRALLDAKVSGEDKPVFPWETCDDLKRAIEDKDDLAFFYNIALEAMKKHQEDVPFMRLMFYSALEDHSLAEQFFHEFVSRVYDFIGGYIAERQRDGAFREVDPKIAVRAFLGMMIHHSLNNLLWDKRRRLLDIPLETAAKNFAEIMVNGIRA